MKQKTHRIVSKAVFTVVSLRSQNTCWTVICGRGWRKSHKDLQKGPECFDNTKKMNPKEEEVHWHTMYKKQKEKT